jgi:hypothetical protein
VRARGGRYLPLNGACVRAEGILTFWCYGGARQAVAAVVRAERRRQRRRRRQAGRRGASGTLRTRPRGEGAVVGRPWAVEDARLAGAWVAEAGLAVARLTEAAVVGRERAVSR